MLRRPFVRRFIRVLLWLLITLVTLLALLFVWTNWSGRRRWAATQAMFQKEGGSLDFRTLLPETPPEAQNLLAIEPLRDIAAVVDQNADRGAPGTRRRALDALKMPADKTAPQADGVALGKAADVQAWVRYVQESKFVDLPSSPPGTPTQDGRAALTALDARFPLLKQLADGTAQRSEAMFTPGMREREVPGMLFSMPVPHFAGSMLVGRALCLRARLALAAQDGAEAARSITAATRLAHACREECLLIGFLVSCSLELMALEPLWQGLGAHAFAEDDLQRLHTAYATDVTSGALLRSMRVELAAGVDAMDHLKAMVAGKVPMTQDVRTFFGEGTTRLGRALPGGMFDHWKSTLVEVELRHLVQPLQTGLIQAVHAGEAADAEIQQNSNLVLHPDRIVVHAITPAVSTVSLQGLLVETRRRQACAAIALGRFYLKQGKFPGKLEELVPEFMPQGVPADPCDGKPLRYSLPASGTYVLWSVGVDGADDGGKVNVDKTGRAKLNKRDYQGDWTWQFTPVN